MAVRPARYFSGFKEKSKTAGEPAICDFSGFFISTLA